ncbi:MAG: MotA/TolQ/ExbB proton channel family protein [Bacteroidia bacterium]|nr:MotA/TolQ/ExbB proton channel family protein [Bacteroidia bacterium]
MLFIAAQTPTDTIHTSVAPIADIMQQQNEITLFEMLLKGGPILIPLALLFILVIYFTVERLMYLSKNARFDKQFIFTIQEFVKKGDIDSAIHLCEKTNTPQALMIKQGLERIGKPETEIKEAMDIAASLSLSYMEKNLNVLNIIGRVAPMFGFIGTIIGVIVIFYDISLAKTVEIEVISTGLYQKMISSATGLAIGILSFIFYHWLNAKIEKAARHLEETQLQFLEILNKTETV